MSSYSQLYNSGLTSFPLNKSSAPFSPFSEDAEKW